MKSIISLLLISFVATVSAETATVESMPMRFVTNIDDERIFDQLKTIKTFSQISKEAPGNPVALIVSMSDESGMGAGNFATGLLAAMTLGITPVVETKDMVLRYELFVNGNKVFTAAYNNEFSNTGNMYNAQSNRAEMDKDAADWVLTTLPDVQQKISESAEIQQLLADYTYYFVE